MTDKHGSDDGGLRGGRGVSGAPRVRAGVPISQTLFEHVAYTYGTTSIPAWRALESGSEEIGTLRDAERLAFLLGNLVEGNWYAYELLRREHALVADLGLELLRPGLSGDEAHGGASYAFTPWSTGSRGC
jgi:hypothetical protein